MTSASEIIPRPAVRALARAGAAARLRLVRGRDGVVRVRACEGVGVGCACGRTTEKLALGVVLASPGWVGEGVVGVVDYLELAGADGAFFGVLGDAVGVGFESCSGVGYWLGSEARGGKAVDSLLVRIADLRCRGALRDLKDGVVVGRGARGRHLGL